VVTFLAILGGAFAIVVIVCALIWWFLSTINFAE
jgi:hypothetical protein